jgi:2-isopropylmalate synthase
VISGINRAYARSDAEAQAHFFDAVLREVGHDGERSKALQAG